MLNQNLEFEMKNEIKKIKIKGIPFGVLLAGKVADGSKTMTRRVMKDGVPFGNWDGTVKHCPYAVGQLLYVREPWRVGNAYDKPSGSKHIPDNEVVNYLSDKVQSGMLGRGRIARFMPARFARTFLRVTGVRYERLGEISHSDAVYEGVDSMMHDDERVFYDYLSKGHDMDIDAIDSFFSLWDSINGKDSHLQNPWVWVISFERVEMLNPWNEAGPMVLLSSYGMASWDHPITKMGYVVNVTAAVGGWVWKIDRADLRTVRKSVLWPTEKEATHDLNRFLRLSILNPAML